VSEREREKQKSSSFMRIIEGFSMKICMCVWHFNSFFFSISLTRSLCWKMGGITFGVSKYLHNEMYPHCLCVHSIISIVCDFIIRIAGIIVIGFSVQHSERESRRERMEIFPFFLFILKIKLNYFTTIEPKIQESELKFLTFSA
jgi:heme/copper-type cytochrome/quinol oxidase subunit 1